MCVCVLACVRACVFACVQCVGNNSSSGIQKVARLIACHHVTNPFPFVQLRIPVHFHSRFQTGIRRGDLTDRSRPRTESNLDDVWHVKRGIVHWWSVLTGLKYNLYTATSRSEQAKLDFVLSAAEGREGRGRDKVVMATQNFNWSSQGTTTRTIGGDATENLAHVGITSTPDHTMPHHRSSLSGQMNELAVITLAPCILEDVALLKLQDARFVHCQTVLTFIMSCLLVEKRKSSSVFSDQPPSYNLVTSK